MTSTIKVDTISEKTSANGVSIDSVTLKDGGIAATAASTITTADNTDTLTLISTDTDSAIGPNLNLYRNAGNGADADNLATVAFAGNDDAGNATDFYRITAQIEDASNGSEDVYVHHRSMVAGTEQLRMSLYQAEAVFNDGSNDIDFRVESNDGTHALFVDAGNNVVIVGGIDGSGTTPVPTNTNGGTDPVFQLQGANNANQHTFHISAAIDAQNNPGSIVFSKSRDNTLNGNTILENGDRIGEIIFCGADGTDRNPIAGKICADVDGTPGSNDMPGRLEFHTTGDGADSSTERMRILSTGNVCIGQTDDQGGTRLLVAYGEVNDAAGHFRSTHASFVNSTLKASANRTGSSAFHLITASSNNEGDNEFFVRGDGVVQSDGGTAMGSPADYAEMFEWKDGNTESEERFGFSVILDENKVVKATDSDDVSKIIGVVSANPAVLGDAASLRWSNKYLRDEWNKNIQEEYTVTEWTETTYEENTPNTKEIWYETDKIPSDVTAPTEDVKDSDGRVIKTKAIIRSTEIDGETKLKRRKLNSNFDESKTYIPRIERKEWDAIGMMGKLRLRKGQPTGTNWIKMRDISDTVEEWLVR